MTPARKTRNRRDLLRAVLGTLLAASVARSAAPLSVMVRNGKFVNRWNGKEVLLRGFNYIRLDNPKGGKHTTFAPQSYDGAKAEEMFAALEAGGFNAVRVFVNIEDRFAGSMFHDTPDGKPSPAYVANLADFLGRAQRHGIVVMPTFEFQPLTDRYKRRIDKVPGGISGANAVYLHLGHIRARQRFFVDMIRALKAQNPKALQAILAYDLQNECCYSAGYPFDANEGTFAAANGKTYDLATQKTQLADESAVFWIDSMAEAIRHEHPEALVAASVFTYEAVGRTGPGDFGHKEPQWQRRYPFRPLAIAWSQADIVDIHLYSGNRADLASTLRSVEYEQLRKVAGQRGKALFTGEFGVFRRDSHPDVESAARWAVELADRCLGLGSQGWLYWTYDCWEQKELWQANVEDALIARALASVCAPGDAAAAIRSVGLPPPPEQWFEDAERRRRTVVPYGDFEDSPVGAIPPGWELATYGKQPDQGSVVVVDPGQASHGSRSLRIAAKVADGERIAVLGPTFRGKVGDRYHIQASLRASSPSGVFAFLLAKGWGWHDHCRFQVGETWGNCAWTTTVEKTNSKGELYFRIDVPHGATVWLDDLTIVKLDPEPAGKPDGK